jgi:xanthine dehydrogenase accessory factor
VTESDGGRPGRPDDHGGQGDPACAAAHGHLAVPGDDRLLVAVFASPVAAHLLHFGRHLGYATVLLEPDPGAVPADLGAAAGTVAARPSDARLGPAADVVVTDHDRPELGDVLADVLAYETRWVGVMGSLRHTAPHVAALADRGVPEADVARVHRPVGLNIGSRSPAEIALATLAGLLADRHGRPGGFTFAPPAGASTAV